MTAPRTRFAGAGAPTGVGASDRRSHLAAVAPPDGSRKPLEGHGID